jgi:hypothetical protein
VFIIIYYFLPWIIALGIITSIEDLKEGKIRNKYILISIFYAILANIIVIIVGYILAILNKQIYIVHWSYLLEWLVGAILSLVLGFIIWYAKLWTEGDAKLYFAYALLVPLSIYNFGYVKYFPSLIILINTFIPLIVYYFIKIIIKSCMSADMEQIKKFFNIGNLITPLLLIFCISWLGQLLGIVTKISLLNYFLLLLITIVIQRIFKKSLLPFLIIVSVLRLIIDKSNLSLTYFLPFISLAAIAIILNFVLNNISSKVIYSKASISDLKPGMTVVTLPDDSAKLEKGHKSINVILDRLLSEQGAGSMQLELNSNNIKQISEYASRNKIKNALFNVKDTMPFAPFIFGGVLITIFLKGNMMGNIFRLEKYIAANIAYLCYVTIAITIISIVSYYVYTRYVRKGEALQI